MSDLNSPSREFERLLRRAYIHGREIRQQEALIDAIIARGSREELEHEWQALVLLFAERKLISQRLRSVFDV